MIEVALILAGVTLVVGIGAALGLRLLPTVRLQVTGLALSPSFCRWLPFSRRDG